MTKEKKTLLLLGIAILLTAIVFLMLIFLRLQQSQEPVPQQVTPTPTPKQTGGKITVSGIKVNNFLASPKEVNKNGDALFVDTKRYNIVYLAKFNEFIISILATPFEQVRKEAENDFLQTLGITKQDACKLKVTLGVPHYVNPQLAKETYRLSFCENRQ